MLQTIRGYFAAQGVLEVETPLLGHAIGTDPNLDIFSSRHAHGATLYLQTSPEFAMKRLLAAGSGSIFQICKAFRNGESGRFHNPEFTLLEWYRVGFGLTELMDDVAALLRCLGNTAAPWQHSERISYGEAFLRHTGLDALEFSPERYQQRATELGLPEAAALCGNDHALWLDLLFSHWVQPHLGWQAVCLVYDYPACQSSLARLKPGEPRLTERVEVFVNGVELGNGYHELADPEEQARRFHQENAQRAALGLPPATVDGCLLAALRHGLPDCAGIAIGLDRLLLLLTGSAHIDDVLAFPLARA